MHEQEMFYLTEAWSENGATDKVVQMFAQAGLAVARSFDAFRSSDGTMQPAGTIEVDATEEVVVGNNRFQAETHIINHGGQEKIIFVPNVK